jgi:hypothetical protein
VKTLVPLDRDLHMAIRSESQRCAVAVAQSLRNRPLPTRVLTSVHWPPFLRPKASAWSTSFPLTGSLVGVGVMDEALPAVVSAMYRGSMFNLFKRKPRRPRVDGEQGLQRIADARLQMEAMGRLPGDVASSGSRHEPAPEYIAEAATPSEELWARMQAEYREKNEGQPGT